MGRERVNRGGEERDFEGFDGEDRDIGGEDIDDDDDDSGKDGIEDGDESRMEEVLSFDLGDKRGLEEMR